jgi:hypothetical protein
MKLKPKREELLVILNSLKINLNSLEKSLGRVRLYERLLITAEPKRILEISDASALSQVWSALDEEIKTEGASIYKMSVVFLWTEVEVFTNDFIKSWIMDFSEVFTLPIFEQVDNKESIATFEKFSREEQIDYYVSRLKDRMRSGQNKNKHVKLFLEVLKSLDFSIDESKVPEKDLTELQQVRNAIVHNNGQVDNHFLRVCPWLAQTYSQNDYILINSDIITRYGVAAIDLFDYLVNYIDTLRK